MAVAEPSAPTEPKYYVWWFPGAPVKVHLGLDVVQRLRPHLKSAVADEGLLLGTVRNATTEVLDFQPASGRLISDLLALHDGQPQRSVVGYYRTQTGDALHLNDADLSRDARFFGGPHDVLLVIQQVPSGIPKASFFFHDEAGKLPSFSFMDFPFDPTLLASEERGRTKRSLRAADDQPAPGSMPAPEAAPSFWRRHPKAVLILGVLAVVTIVSGGIWMSTRSLQKWVRRTVQIISQGSATPVYPSIGLHASRQGRDVALTWNRESPLITGAISGSLSIEDSETRNEFLLDSTQLKSGSLLYSPVAERIVMRLAATNPVNTVMESVTVVTPKTGRKIPASAGSNEAARKAPRETITRKPFTAPHADTKAAVPFLNEPPAVEPNSGVSVAVLPFLAMPTASLPVAGTTALSAPQRQEAQAAGPYQPPVPIHKVTPNLRLPPSVSRPQYVNVRVAIDKTGRVTKVDLVSRVRGAVSSYAEVVSAVRLWKFQPAQLNKKPIDSEILLKFIFND
jgi:hypothetical protein